MVYKLSILIPSLSTRCKTFLELYDALIHQMGDKYGTEIQIVSECDDGTMSIGDKRNILLERAEGEYLCFIDDDDLPSRNYIEKMLEGIEKGVDCVSLRGVITWDGDNPELFEHSIKYDAYRTNDTGAIKYERYPNHLNCIRSSIAKQFKFPSTNHGEDTDFATQIFKSGLIKTEHFVNEVTYHYKYVTKK